MLVKALKLTRTLGLGWLLYRLGYAFKKRAGVLRLELPARSWESQPLSSWIKPSVPSEPSGYAAWRKSHQSAFFFAKADERFKDLIGEPAMLLAEAEDILKGKWKYFDHAILQTGFPPQWHANPLTGRSAPADRHWSQMGDFDYGDIKLIWESSRFASAYTLVRAYAVSRDERFPAAFWNLLEDWAAHNPPQLGPNWMCGQEASFRIMAWLFAFFGFAESSHSTPERIAKLAAMFAVHARRIEGNISYALSQRNNHSISEAMGLWTVGLLFPEFKQAERWRDAGKKILEAEALRQIGEDGSYIQHSFNYHRLMLQDYLWTMRLGELNGQRLSKAVYDRVDRAVQFLRRFTDPETGQAPDYGGNDGALILPLNRCDFADFRPIVQAGNLLIHKDYIYPPGPWDEDLAWLFGPEAAKRVAVESPPKGGAVEPSETGQTQKQSLVPAPTSEGTGGYYALRGHGAAAMIRCARYKNRPSHADQLHLDLQWRGINVACDPGSYLYNGESPWANGLAGTAVHNTVTVDDRDQMTRMGRFLWADWAQGTARGQVRSDQGRLESFEGQHDGYRKLGIKHRRAVLRVEDDLWLVVDDIAGHGEHSAELHWLLPDFPYELDEKAGRMLLNTPAGPFAVQVWCGQAGTLRLVREGRVLHQSSPPDSLQLQHDVIRGWRSRYYAEKEPALSLAFRAMGPLPLRFITVLAGVSASVEYGEVPQVEIKTDEARLKADLSLPGATPILQQARLTRGARTDELESAAQRKTGGRRPGTHLLLIHQSFTPPAQAGGTRHYELTSRLVKDGHRATIIASDVDYLSGKPKTERRRLVSEQDLDGVRVLSAYTYSAFHRSFVHRVFSFLSFAGTSLFAAWKVRGVDVVMGTTPPIFQAVSAWLIAAVRRLPFALEVRDLWPEFAIDIGVLKNPILIGASRRLERFLYRHANHCIVNSPAYRDYLISKKVPPGKITLIPNGVDPEMFELADDGRQVREQFGLADRFVVTYAGAMGMANDLETLMRAAYRLRGDPAIQFLLVGDGKERPKLEMQARKLNLPNVTFTGPQPKTRIPQFLAASDACIATLKNIRMFRTTYPNKVFDYMAAGRPTIVAIDGVIREVVEKSQGGIFVPPGNDSALAEAAQRLNRDRTLARKMGAAAREYVVKHFHRQHQAEQLASLLGKLKQT